ncbi:MAG: type 2 lantipeptide synthetase LanM [Verrucomicrobia bacterium]|nr:type 2 lantipeptide synthetase LanM [Verrucomicrobiota bacterium]
MKAEDVGAAVVEHVRSTAANLGERLSASPASDGDLTEGEARWQRLRAVLTGYGPAAEREFCAQHGLAVGDIAARLSPCRVSSSPPAWAERLGELLQPLGEPGYAEAGHPFAELLGPLLGRAERALARDLGGAAGWLPEAAWSALLGALRARWERDFAPALYACFDLERSLLPGRPGPGSDLYRAWLGRLAREGLGEVARRFPVAARQWAEQTVQWQEALSELTRHFLADRTELQRVFGLRDPQVRRIDWPLSDFHGGGRAVARLEFAAGEVVYYKPGDRSLEVAFDRLFRSWLVRRQPSRAPALRGLVRADHSWIEALPAGLPGSPREARELARDLGRLGLLGLLLGTTDLHPGNVLAGPGWVSVCDAETVLHPERPEFPWRAPFLEPAWRDLDQPFRTFLASFAVAGHPDVHLRSCLGRWEREPAKVRQPVWWNVGCDTLRLTHERGTWPNAFAPAFAALRAQLGPRWARALLAGATEARARLLRAGPAAQRAVQQLGARPRRLLCRNTVTYAWMLAEARRPALWIDGFERSLFFERLGELSGDGRLLDLWERTALECGDVPRCEVREWAGEHQKRLFDAARPVFDPVVARRARRALLRAFSGEEDPTLEAQPGAPGLA